MQQAQQAQQALALQQAMQAQQQLPQRPPEADSRLMSALQEFSLAGRQVRHAAVVPWDQQEGRARCLSS